MKKNLLFLVLALVCLVYSNTRSQTLAISANSSNLCINSKAYASVTSTMAGATTYTWMAYSNSCTANATIASGGLSTLIEYPCCGVFTISCIAYNGATWLGAAVTQVTVSCNNASTLTVSSSASNGTACAGSTTTLSAGGNMSYTWVPGSFNGANIVISPSVSTCFTVFALNSSGCYNMSPSYCMSVVPIYNIGVAGNSVICAGSSTSLSLTGGPSFVTNPGNIVSANPVLTPSVSSLYSITCPSGAYPCPTNSMFVVIVNPTPTLSVSSSGGSSTLCSGSSQTLYASGGTTYSWSNGPLTSSNVVSPTVNTCYSVSITNSASACSNSAVYCLTVMPLPSLTVGGNNTVCLGSSTTLSVSGASSYTWSSNNSNLSTLNILPPNTTAVTGNVSGYGSNGCVGSLPYSVSALSNCADVWPGDANRDGVVTTSDVLELGLAASNTGAARSSASNAWTSQFANAWAGTVSTGWNMAHADCNGDGVINNNDTTAISANFSLTHSFKGTGTEALNPEISLVPQQSVAYEGIWNKADIIVGDGTNPQSQIYGVAFDVNYDQNMIQPDSIKIKYLSSFLSAGNQNIVFGKPLFANGKLHCATVRIDHANVNGNGIIAELWYKVKSNLPDNSSINLSVANGLRIGKTGNTAVLSNSSNSNLNITDNLVGIASENALQQTLSFYPNPANDLLTLRNNSGLVTKFILCDVSGREILKGEFSNQKTIDISVFEKGIYILRFESGKNQLNKQIVIE